MPNPKSLEDKVALVVGSCGLDRLVTVPHYPKPDEKIRTSAYHEIGGGNAANTAAAMGQLKTASFLQGTNLCIRLLTKLGDDAIGQQLLEELHASEVDVVAPRPPGSTTAFTTIIVSEDEQQHTRTCLHTPGTCGELQPEEVKDMDLDKLFHNVIHLHSDSRHTDASLFLAKEAKRRGIPVSCDAEKDRKTKALDELMLLSDRIFTNSNYLGAYLKRLHSEHEQEHKRPSWEDQPKLEIVNNSAWGKESVETLVKSMTPSVFYTRWHPEQAQKQVIVTQGHMGALLFTPLSSLTISTTSTSTNKTKISKGDCPHALQMHHNFSDTINGEDVRIQSSYAVETTGVMKKVSIVDSTGAGDAFIAGYLLASSFLSDDKFALDFGSWVAGQKLQTPGARSKLLWGDNADNILGRDVGAIKYQLKRQLNSFNTE